jgi:acid phosphatase
MRSKAILAAVVVWLLPVTFAQLAAPPKLQSPEALDSVLWAQTSVEHDAAYLQAFRLAGLMLDRAIADKKWTAALEQRSGYENLPPAVVLDLDETVLDNSPAEAQSAKDGFAQKVWEDWEAHGHPNALPGAVKFTSDAAKKVRVIFVTNRMEANRQATKKVLADLGFPLQGEDSLYCRAQGAPSDKGTRRETIAKKYRIVMLLGDDLGDFISNVNTTPEARRELVKSHADWWGERWIVLPNAMYGSWERALYGKDDLPAEQWRKKVERLRGVGK